MKLAPQPKIDWIKQKIIQLNLNYSQNLSQARKNLTLAMKSRWEYGKLIYENYKYIIDICGSQKNFAEIIGDTESVVSNNKRAYKFLLDSGCKTWDDVISLLKRKQIPITVKSFEKVGTLLNEPNKETNKWDQIKKDHKRLEELRAEAEDILRRNEPGATPDFIEDAFEYIKDIEEIQEYLESFNPEKTGWRSEKYLDFVRNYGRDLITGEPCERSDPHHSDQYGSSGPEGDKLPDYYVIPVTRNTHMKLESGKLRPSQEEILKAQFTVLSSFLTLNLK